MTSYISIIILNYNHYLGPAIGDYRLVKLASQSVNPHLQSDYPYAQPLYI
jgi:hypothetical protein